VRIVIVVIWTPVLRVAGDMNMRFYNVRDLRADGLFIQRYLGPGLEVSRLHGSRQPTHCPALPG